MNDAQLALRRWKTIYDQLAQADRQLKGLSADRQDEAGLALKEEIARLTFESDSALQELNRCIALLKQKQSGSA